MISPRSIAVAPQYGTPKKPHDYRSFQSWAKQFLAFHGLGLDRRVIIDNTARPRAQRDAVVRALCDSSRIPKGDGPMVVAMVCHGLRRRIQLGFNIETAGGLAEVLAGVYGADVRVVLYACSTGGGPGHAGDGGFADQLRDALCRAGAVHCRVLAHSTAGRADRNPFVRSFDGGGQPFGLAGGYDVIPRRLVDGQGKSTPNPLWPRWVRALRGGLRWEIATLTQAEIRERLTA